MTDLMFAFHFSMTDLLTLDRLIFRHHVLFLDVHAYRLAGIWMPKHLFTQNTPLDILLYGPARYLWCMRFEAMNQVPYYT